MWQNACSSDTIPRIHTKSCMIHLLVLLVLNIKNAVSWEYVPSSPCFNCSSLCETCTLNSPPPPTVSPPPQYPPPPPANCPPATVVQCCQIPPPPQPYSYLPYYNYSASKPVRLRGPLVGSLLFSLIFLLLFFGVFF